MATQGWDRVKALFAEVVERPPGDRTAFIDREAGDDEELRRRVRALLDADAAATRFLESGPADVPAGAPPVDPWTGRRIGRYEVVREVGRGGTGLVLLVRRIEGLRGGEAALKIVPAALVEPHLEARFRDEVRILAELDHPNIARLLDAGATPDGLAYLVMEYVDGPALDVHADAHTLDIEARLRLFLGVLGGIDHAHARGVVHRDLKPGNVLVGSDGVPRIVDFGIARLLRGGAGDGDTLVLTRTANRMLTPEYASPEQVRGEPVDPRTDVYSLGVLLYRLLTGRPPYAVDSTRPEALVRAVCEATPSRPSDVVTRPVEGSRFARNRSSTRDHLVRALRGDLDTVVLHALAKNPADRYATAGAFADDVERYLEGRPIRVRPVGRLRRAGAWARRRRTPLVVAGAAVAVVAAGVGQAREGAVQRRAASAAESGAAAFVTTILETLGDETAAAEPGPTARRVAAVEAAAAALDSLEASLGGPADPALVEALAAAHQEVGSVQGHPTYANVGRPDEARRSYERSLALWSRLAELDPTHGRARLEIPETRILLADLAAATGDLERQAGLLDEAERGLEAVEPGSGDVIGRLSILAMLHERQGNRWLNRGDFVRAGRYFEALPDLARRVAAEMPPGPGRVAGLEEVPLALQLVSAVRARAGDPEAAIEIGREAVRLADSIAALPGVTQRVRGIQANVWGQLGWRYNDVARPDQAERAFDVAIEVSRSILSGDPANVAAMGLLGTMLGGRGRARIIAEDWSGALADQRESQPLLRAGYGEGPTADLALAPTWRQMGEALSGLGRLDEADDAYRTVFTFYDGAGPLSETAQQRKQRAFADMSWARHLMRRAAAGTAACSEVRAAETKARGLWDDLRDEGLVSDGEEAFWAGFAADRTGAVCPTS